MTETNVQASPSASQFLHVLHLVVIDDSYQSRSTCRQSRSTCRHARKAWNAIKLSTRLRDRMKPFSSKTCLLYITRSRINGLLPLGGLNETLFWQCQQLRVCKVKE